MQNDERRPLISRAYIERADDENKTLRVSVSSETACRNIVRTRDGYAIGNVILSHAPGAINGAWITDGIALRNDHGGEVVARGMDMAIEGGKLVARSIIWGASDAAQVIKADAESGVIRDMSIEADYDPEDVDEMPDGDFIIRKWTPLAAAFVPVPADPSVGINRELLRKADEPAAQEETEQAEATAPASAEAVEAEAEAKTERAKPMNEDKVEGEALVDPVATIQVVDDNSISRAELADFSITRAIRSMVPGMDEGAKVERSISRKIAKAVGRSPRGIFVPVMKRDFTTAASNGSGLVPTEHLASEFIEVLRQKLVLDRLGVRYLGGLRGNIDIPKQTASTTAYWVAEGAAPTESNPVVGQIAMTPHTVGAYTDITRRLLEQASPAADAVVQNDILEVLARAIQNAVFNGTGANGQPTGILNTEGVTTATIASSGSPTWAEIVAFCGEIDKYWVDGGNWVLNPASFAALRAVTRATYGDRMVADIVGGQKYLADEPAYTTSALAAGKAIYGKFDNVFVGMWGALDIMVDPYSLSTSGSVRIVGLQDVDVAVRHPEAFVITDKFPGA